MRFNWSKANSKLKKTSSKLKEQGWVKPNIVSFNLPAYKSKSGRIVCFGAKACVKYCYAQQGRYLMPSVSKPREENLSLLLENKDPLKVADWICEDLQQLSKKTGVVRIHDSGDFFASWYLDAWIEVATRNPEIVFYAYTKSVPLFGNKELPENLRITFSEGGKWDDEIAGSPHSKVFSSHEEMHQANYSDGTETDLPAILNNPKVGLVYHGTKKLTEEIKTLLR